MEKKTYHHGDLHAALIEAGLKLLGEREADTLGLREVARAVGVSATAVYRHFPDKGALLSAMAREGLARWEVDAADADRLMEIIERRCVEHVNGASWQAAAFHKLYDRLDRADALREMTVRYRDHMHSNEPVHTWPLPS